MRPYPAYKDSGVEWFPEIPEHWEVWKLAHVVPVISSGTTPNTENPAYYLDGEIPWVNTGDLNDATLQDCAKRVTELAVMDHSPLKLYPIGSVVIALYGATIGKLGILGFSACVNQACCVLSPSGGIDSRYLFFWLLGFRNRIITLASGGGQPNISQEIVRSLRLALPPLPEQQAIAQFLDKEVAKIDALVAEQRRLIALLAEKRQAVISHAVTKGLNPTAPLKPSGIDWLGDIPEGWEVVQAGRVASVLSGFAFPSDGFSHDAADTPLLRGVNIGVGELRWDDVVYWCRSCDDRLSPFEVKVGDIVIGMDRPWISAGLRIAEVQEKHLPCLLLQRVGLIRTSPLLNPRFLLLQYSGSNFRDFLAPEMTGVSVPHISPSQITSFPITLPTREEQDAIIAFLDAQTVQFDALTAAATSAISLLQERRAALISAAVTGKIDLRPHFAQSLSEPEIA